MNHHSFVDGTHMTEAKLKMKMRYAGKTSFDRISGLALQGDIPTIRFDSGLAAEVHISSLGASEEQITEVAFEIINAVNKHDDLITFLRQLCGPITNYKSANEVRADLGMPEIPPVIELPVRLDLNVYDEHGGYYEHRLYDANGEFILAMQSPDPSDSQEAHERSQKRAQTIRDAINGKLQA
jgi:hypothetical protein